MSIENDKIILQEADNEGVGNLVERAQNRVILDNASQLDLINYVDDGSFVKPSGTGVGSLAIGDDAQTDAGEHAVAIGTNARAEFEEATAVGASAWALDESTVAVGKGCRAQAFSTTAIGENVHNNVQHSAKIGVNNFCAMHIKDEGRLHLIGDKSAYNLPSYTVATVPTGSEGDMIYVTDGDAGNKCVAVHDGSNWKVISLGATISSS